ncbi:DUF2627 domain-containing protein [Shimazuella sp. AN120528]|uniref:DUF2627 family protein n=1 Tax=Shimazuella soli TaxID=1892854 RepID=UPI001F0F0B25|nr:DUF2627 family protein [Shimazuella soli]MCH5584216.1 DUF2627 domain-containing protein [Shimazuella soli]
MQKEVFQRLIAIILMCIPGGISVYGWTLMRDILFSTAAGESFPIFTFVLGLILFLLGLAIVGGFIFYRDKKRNKIQPKLLKKTDEYKKEKHAFLDKV